MTIQRSSLVLSAVVFCACAPATPDATNSAAVAADTPIISGVGGRCLDDFDDATTNGNKIQIWACNQSAAQNWIYTNGTIVGPGGKCLDVKDNAQASGTLVDLYECNGTKAQQWTVSGTTITSSGGYCLDVHDAVNDNGTQVQIATCDGTEAQSWKFSSTSTGGSCVASSSAGPVVSVAPAATAPGQAALLFGAKFGSTTQVRGVRLADGAPGLPPRASECVPTNATALTVLQTSSLSAKAEIPSNWTPGVYALVAETSAGTSKPIVINRPRIDWLRSGPGGMVTPGGKVDVYGRSFGTRPSAWLVSSTGAKTALASAPSDGYAATFAVPRLAAGHYELYVHSGLGGPSGFSDPFAVSLAATAAWPSTVFTVAAGTGNDDAEFAKAVSDVTKNGGGVIEVANGSYQLLHGIVLPPKTVLRSASGNRNDVIIAFNEKAIPFPYGIASDGYFTIEALTIESSNSARLVQCPNGPDFMRDPVEGAPQYQPDPPCQSATLHDVSITLSTLRYLVTNNEQTNEPVATDMVVINGDDCEISDSSLVNSGGSAISLSRMNRFNLLRNELLSGTTRISPTAAEPLAPGVPSGGAILFGAQSSAIVGNTVGLCPRCGADSTMGIEYVAKNVYIADNVIGPNLSDYGEGFSFDAPYYPNYIGPIKGSSANTVTIEQVLNEAKNSVFAGPAVWPANAGTSSPIASDSTLVGSSLIVVNGTGLGQYSEIVSNTATASNGTTRVTLDRDFVVPLDSTSVVAIVIPKSKVVLARNTFKDCAVGVQLYAGGYDFVIDGSKGATLQGTYCYGDDFMGARASAEDQQRRYSGCYFVQFINNTLTKNVDPSYPWKVTKSGGVFTPFDNGLIGVHLAIGNNPMLPAQRGLGSVGTIVRGNDVADFSLGFNYGGNPLPSPMPTVGSDNIVELNKTQSAPVGYVIDPAFVDTLVRDDTCNGCTALIEE